MSRKDVQNWQFFGMISGFCTFYALFLPFTEIQSSGTTKNIDVYELIISVMLNISQYVLNESITDAPLEYSANYLILIAMIIMIISAVMLLWTSITGNSFICILCSFIYTPLSLSFIFYTVYSSNIVSAGYGYYLLIVGSFTAFIIPFVYLYQKN